MNWRVLPVSSLLFVLLSASSLVVMAEEKDVAHKVVIQVSSADETTQKIALNNAVNLQQAYGMDNVHVVIVAYRPGLDLLTDKSTQAQRIESLAMHNIHFNACGNTMNKVAKKTAKEPVLLDGVEVVPAGVGFIMDLQEQGYAYVRP